MKELLYKKSEAVAALNRVDGFHPMELARKIGEEGQEEQLYLDVKYRKLWFRLVNPAGKIISRIITFTENMAVVEARIYLDKCDQEDNYVANSFSQKFRSDDPKFGDKFLEMAETAAVGRALSDAGYGVQFADVGEENDPAQVDAGIPYQNPQMPDSGAMENAAMPDSGVMPNAPMPTYGEMPGQPEYAGQQMMNQFYQQAQAAGSTIYHGSGQMPGYGSAPAASTPPKTGQMLQGALQNACMGIAVMNIIGCFLQFLGQFRLTVFLHLFCSHIVQDPEQILCSMLIAAALILTDISDAGVVFIQNGIGLCKSDAPAFFRKHLFGFLYSILFGTWTGRSIALIIPASFWGGWFDILWNGTAFSGRKRSAAADFIP